MCFTVPILPLQSSTLAQRFLVNITPAFLAKYIVGSKPLMSFAPRCFALRLVWYALICTMGSSSCLSLVKLYVATYSVPNDSLTAEVLKFVMLLTFWGVLDKSKFQSSRVEFPIFFSCLKVSKLFLYNVCTFCSFVLFKFSNCCKLSVHTVPF